MRPRIRRARPGGSLPRAFLLLVAPAVGAGCGGFEGPSARERPDDVPARRIVEAEWETAFGVGGTLHDTLLQAPSRLAADDSGVVVLDPHPGRILRFAADGAHRWSFGRKGRGPGELRSPRDVAMDREGRIWLLDVGNQRVTVVGPAGALVRTLPLEGIVAGADQIVPLGGGGAVVLVRDGAAPIVRIGPGGEVVERSPFPWGGFDALEPMATQMWAGGHPSSGRWAAAFAMGDGYFIFRATTLLREGWFPEPIPFPGIRREVRRSLLRTETVTRVQEPVFAATSVAVTVRRVHILFHGTGPYRSRIVDGYDAATGEYVESLVLPRPVATVAVGGGIVYALVTAPYPQLLAWRRTDGPLR